MGLTSSERAGPVWGRRPSARGCDVIRVLVVRDGGYFGVPVRTLLGGQPDIEVVGTLAFEHNLVDAATRLSPDVAVFDTEYMVSQVLPVAAEFRARIPDCSLLMLCDPTKRGMLPPRRRTGDLSF